jgi:hypothetical protein
MKFKQEDIIGVTLELVAQNLSATKLLMQFILAQHFPDNPALQQKVFEDFETEVSSSSQTLLNKIYELKGTIDLNDIMGNEPSDLK